MWFRWTGMTLAVLACLPAAVTAQTLRLREALDRAALHAYANRMADAEARERAGSATGAMRALLPSVRVEGGYLRTTDPLGAFGDLLRQRAVTPAAFDPASLNFPAAIGNVSSSFVVEQPLFNPDAWFGRQAAHRAAAAAFAAAEWEHAATRVSVVRAYYGGVLASERVATLDSAARAAHGHLRAAESRYQHGLATRSDALLAAVRAGQVDADLLQARSDARLARWRLALVMGSPGDTTFELPVHLPDSASISRLAAEALPVTPGARGDVRAAHLALEAASADRRRATMRFVPSVNSFGRLDWNSADRPFGGPDSWTAGVMLSWSLFAGGSQIGEQRSASARESRARAAADAASAQGQLEWQAARDAVDVALARMGITGAAVEQSTEAHRIVGRKYEAGLATAVELFDAAAEETAARLGFSAARYQAITAMAEALHAAGHDPADLARLDSSEP